MSFFPTEFIRAIPKTDLHLHLDGSLRVSTLIELAKEAGVELPAADEAGLRAEVFKDKYNNLEEYLRGFALTTAAMQSEKALFRVSYELMQDNAAEGVRYIEVRFAPQLLMSDTLSFRQVVEAVDRGPRQACDELNTALPAGEPSFNYGIIVCAMRFFNEHFSPYYRDFCRQNSDASPSEIIRRASIAAARDTAKLRRESLVQVVGFDIAGAENGFPASEHVDAYSLIDKGLLGKTVHAGEAYGPESIYQAVAKLQAHRIGHGLHLFDAPMIQDADVPAKQRYVDDLADYIAKRGIALEVCLTSNLQTTPTIGEARMHPLGTMLERGLAVCLCTDNRLVSNTTVCKEYQLAVENFAIDPPALRSLAMEGFTRSFLYPPHAAKLAYVRRVGEYYDTLARRFDMA